MARTKQTQRKPDNSVALKKPGKGIKKPKDADAMSEEEKSKE